MGRALGAFSVGFLALMALFFAAQSLAPPPTATEAAASVVLYSFLTLLVAGFVPQFSVNERPRWYRWYLVALGFCVAISDCYFVWRAAAVRSESAAALLFEQGSVLLMVLSVCFLIVGIASALWTSIR